LAAASRAQVESVVALIGFSPSLVERVNFPLLPKVSRSAATDPSSYLWWTRDNGTFNARGVHGKQIHIDRARRLVVAINSATPEAVLTKEALTARVALFDAIRAAIDAEDRRGAARQ
jgi:CubicO group peptidase (beta-lactamase class C family)